MPFARLAFLVALALALAGCATALAGPIPRVIDVTNSYQTAPIPPEP